MPRPTPSLFDQMLRHTQALLLPQWQPQWREARSAIRGEDMAGHVAVKELGGGLTLAHVDMQADRPLALPAEHSRYHAPLTLVLPLAGCMHWREQPCGPRQHIRADGRLHWSSGHMRQMGENVEPGRLACGFVAVPEELLLRWLDTAASPHSARRLTDCLRSQHDEGPLHTLPMPAAMRQDALRLQTLHMAWRNRPEVMTLAHALQIEGLALTLLGHWLQLPPALADNANSGPHASSLGNARLARAVGHALDIIHAEYAQPLSISALARRTGTNECYLKRAFKARTGLGVAAYLRQLRMQQAAALLEEGRLSVQQVARHVGYASASRFAQAFAQAHGRLPSALREAARAEPLAFTPPLPD